MAKSTPKNALVERDPKCAHKIEGRDARGRFLAGHAAPPNAGRPVGAVNLLTKSLRAQVLAGFDKRGISGFVEDLLHDSPAAAAALLSRLLPPEANDEEGPAGVTSVEIVTIPQGHYVMPEDLGVSSFLYNAEEVQEIQQVQARARARADELRRMLLPDASLSDDGPPNGL